MKTRKRYCYPSAPFHSERTFQLTLFQIGSDETPEIKNSVYYGEHIVMDAPLSGLEFTA